MKEEQENNVFTRQHSTPSALRPELIIVLNCFQPKYSGRALPPIVLVQKCGLGATLLQRILAPGGRFGLASFDFAAMLLDCEPAKHLLLTRAGSNIQRGHLVCLVSGKTKWPKNDR